MTVYGAYRTNIKSRHLGTFAKDDMLALFLELLQFKYVIGLALTGLILFLCRLMAPSSQSGARVATGSSGKGRLPPGPRGWPVVGYIGIGFDHPYKEIKKLGQKYGKIFMVPIGKYKLIVLNDYEMIKEAFIKGGDILTDRPKGFNNLHYIFNHSGLFLESGDNYKELRHFFVNALKDFNIASLETEVALVRQCEVAMGKMAALHRKSFDPLFLFNCITTNVITKFAWHKEYDYDDPELHRLIYLCVHLDSSVDKLNILDYIPWLSYFLGTLEANPWIRREKKELLDLFRRNIDEHERTFQENNIRDFIDAFLEKRNRRKNAYKDHDPLYNIDQLLGTMIIVIFGSNISAPVSLALLFKAFTDHPEIQDRVREEVDRVIGRDRTPTFMDQRNMPYTEAAISEAVRFGDVTPLGTMRTPSTNETMSIAGYEIPKESIVVGNFTRCHFDPALWKDPKNYNPSNFLDDDGKCVIPEYFIPFGAGKRICPGLALGKIELFMITTILIQHFTFRSPSAAEANSKRVGYSQHVSPFQIAAQKRE